MGFTAMTADERQQYYTTLAKTGPRVLPTPLVAAYDLDVEVHLSGYGVGCVGDIHDRFDKIIAANRLVNVQTVFYRDGGIPIFPQRVLTKRLRDQKKKAVSAEQSALDETAVRGFFRGGPMKLTKENVRSRIFRDMAYKSILAHVKPYCDKSAPIYYEADKRFFQDKRRIKIHSPDTDILFIALMQKRKYEVVIAYGDNKLATVHSMDDAAAAMNVCLWALLIHKGDYTIIESPDKLLKQDALSCYGYNKSKTKANVHGDYMARISKQPIVLPGFEATDDPKIFVFNIQAVITHLGSFKRQQKGTAAGLWRLIEMAVWATLYYRGNPDNHKLEGYTKQPQVEGVAELLACTGIPSYTCSSRLI